MPLTPDEARARLTCAREKLMFALVMHKGREGFDAQAGTTMALLEVIELLEDALI